jgi:hypothetical protein
MNIHEIPLSVPCDVCGQAAPIVMTANKHGEQLVIVRIEGTLYVTLDCPACGQVQQEVSLK